MAFQNCYSTRRSLTRFFSSSSNSSSNYNSNSIRVPIHRTPSIHIYTCTLHYKYIQRILHPEIQFYMQKTKSSSSTTTTTLQIPVSRNSTHRRQGDLLEMHPCVLQDLPVTFQAFSHKSLQRQLQLLQLLQRHSSLSRHSRHSSLSSLSRHSSHSRHSRDIPDIPVIHDLPAFPGNSSNSTLFQYLQGFHPIPAFSD